MRLKIRKIYSLQPYYLLRITNSLKFVLSPHCVSHYHGSRFYSLLLFHFPDFCSGGKAEYDPCFFQDINNIFLIRPVFSALHTSGHLCTDNYPLTRTEPMPDFSLGPVHLDRIRITDDSPADFICLFLLYEGETPASINFSKMYVLGICLMLAPYGFRSLVFDQRYQ